MTEPSHREDCFIERFPKMKNEQCLLATGLDCVEKGELSVDISLDKRIQVLCKWSILLDRVESTYFVIRTGRGIKGQCQNSRVEHRSSGSEFDMHISKTTTQTTLSALPLRSEI